MVRSGCSASVEQVNVAGCFQYAPFVIDPIAVHNIRHNSRKRSRRRAFQANMRAKQYGHLRFPHFRDAVCGGYRDKLMNRAFATLSAGLLIVWTLAVVCSVFLGVGPVGLFQPGIILFVLLPGTFPTLCIFVWLLIDRNPTTFRLAGTVCAAVGISLIGLWGVYLGTDNGIGRTYVPVIVIPIAGGIVFAYLAYFIGAKLAERRVST